VKIPVLAILFLALTACAWVGDCPEKINLLPMYGNAVKCPEQIRADNAFLATVDKQYQGDRKRAAKDWTERAWAYFKRNAPDTAMMRFNQAWLLDSTNADVFWGFGSLLGNQKKFGEAVLLFKKSIHLHPDNPIVWASVGQSYGNLFWQSDNRSELDSCIKYFKGSYRLDPSDGATVSRLTIAYAQAMEKDSAKKYEAITDGIDPRLLPKEVRKMIRKM
jgi:tetratricopeptide (TPR) repeat protein